MLQLIGGLMGYCHGIALTEKVALSCVHIESSNPSCVSYSCDWVSCYETFRQVANNASNPSVFWLFDHNKLFGCPL